MTIRFDNGYYDSARSMAIVIAIFAGLITFAVLAWIFAIYVKRMDNKKSIDRKKGKSYRENAQRRKSGLVYGGI